MSPFLKESSEARHPKGPSKGGGYLCNTKRARKDVAKPGGTKHRLDAGKGHCSSGPWVAQLSHPGHCFKAIKTLAA